MHNDNQDYSPSEFPLNWQHFKLYRQEFRADLVSKFPQQPSDFLSEYCQHLDNTFTQPTTNVIPFASRKPKLVRVMAKDDVPEVWLEAAADGDSVTLRDFDQPDDFGTMFKISLLNDSKSANQQILRVEITDETRWEYYEDKDVYVVIGEHEIPLHIESGYAKARITAVTGKSIIKIHSDLESD